VALAWWVVVVEWVAGAWRAWVAGVVVAGGGRVAGVGALSCGGVAIGRVAGVTGVGGRVALAWVAGGRSCGHARGRA